MGIVAIAARDSRIVGVRGNSIDPGALAAGGEKGGMATQTEIPAGVDPELFRVFRVAQGRAVAVFALDGACFEEALVAAFSGWHSVQDSRPRYLTGTACQSVMLPARWKP